MCGARLPVRISCNAPEHIDERLKYMGNMQKWDYRQNVFFFFFFLLSCEKFAQQFLNHNII